MPTYSPKIILWEKNSGIYLCQVPDKPLGFTHGGRHGNSITKLENWNVNNTRARTHRKVRWSEFLAWTQLAWLRATTGISTFFIGFKQDLESQHSIQNVQDAKKLLDIQRTCNIPTWLEKTMDRHCFIGDTDVEVIIDIWSSYDENAPRSKDEYFGNKWTIGNIRKETENGKRTHTEVLELKKYVLSSTVRQWNISLNKGSSNIGMAEKCEWTWSHISRNYLVLTEGKKKSEKKWTKLQESLKQYKQSIATKNICRTNG